MKKSHLRVVQIGSILTLPVAIGWLLFQPGFEPVLAVLTSITAIVSTLFMRSEEQDKDKPLPFNDECESVAEIQLDALNVDGAEIMGGGGVANFLHDYQVYFGGRHDEMAKLDAWLTQAERRFGLLVAPAGMGKSALVANWFKRLQDSGQAVVAYHPISLRYGTNSLKQTLHSLLVQMSEAARKEAALESDQPYVSSLDLIDESFSKEQLQEVCFHLSVDYDNLGEGGKRSKAQELIRRCQRNGRLDELVVLCRKMRPHHDWDAAFARSTPDRLLYEPPQEGNNEQLLIDQLQKNLRQPTGWDKPLVVIIDGLDELANQLNQADIQEVNFLPNETGAGIYILAVARGESVDIRDKWLRKLKWDRSPVELFELGALGKEDIREMVSRSKWATEDDKLTLLADKIYDLSEGGDPLVASLWVDRLASLVDKRIETLLELLEKGDTGINGYIDGVFAQLEPIRSGAAKPLFELLSLARGPLETGDINALGIKIDSDQLELLVSLSGRLIIQNAQPAYVFSHSRIRQAVQDIYVSKESTQRQYWLEQFHRYGKCALKQAKNVVDGKMPTVSPYLLNYYAEHLQEDKPSGYEASLYELVDEAWMKAHYVTTSSYEGFLADIQRAWEIAKEIGYKEIHSNNPVTTLPIQLKCALCFSSIASLSGHYLLPALLVREKQLSPSDGRQFIERISDRMMRIKGKLALLEIEETRLQYSEKEISNIVSEMLSQLMDDTQSSDQDRCLVLLRLVEMYPHFESFQLQGAIQLARNFTKPLWRAWALAPLMSHITNEGKQRELTAEVISNCLKINDKDDNAFQHFPTLYKTIANHIPMNTFTQACEEVFKNQRNEMYIEGFFAHLSWEIPDSKAVAFVETLRNALRNRRSFFYFIGEMIAQMSPRLSDEVALQLAEALSVELNIDPHQHYYSLGKEPNEDCTPAFILLAAHRRNDGIKQHLLTLAEKHIKVCSGNENGLSLEDLWSLLRIVKGELPDTEAANQVSQGKLFRNFFSARRLHIYSHAILLCLEPVTIKALLKPVTRTQDNNDLYSYFFIGESGYLLPHIASRLPDNEWTYIYKIGPGKYEYATLGYVRAAIQNIHRHKPQELVADTLDWIKRWVFSSGNLTNELPLAIADYVDIDHLRVYWKGYDQGFVLSLIQQMSPRLTRSKPEVIEEILSLSLLPEYLDKKADAIASYIRYQPVESSRIPWLTRLQAQFASFDDLEQQVGMLEHLSTVVKFSRLSALMKYSHRSSLTRDIHRSKRLIHNNEFKKLLEEAESGFMEDGELWYLLVFLSGGGFLQIQHNYLFAPEARQKLRRYGQHIRLMAPKEKTSQTSVSVKLLASLLLLMTSSPFVWGTTRLFLFAFTAVILAILRILSLIMRVIGIVFERVVGWYFRFRYERVYWLVGRHWKRKKRNVSSGWEPNSIEQERWAQGFFGDRFRDADQTAWEQIQESIQHINYMTNSQERQEAFTGIANRIFEMGIAYPANVYEEYVLKVEALWSKLNPLYIEDALHALDNHAEPETYRILVPVIATKRIDLLPDLIKKCDGMPFAADITIVIYAILAYFLTGKAQKDVIDKVIALSSQGGWTVDDVLDAILIVANYIPQELTSAVLNWVSDYPSAWALARLAPFIADQESLRNQAFDIARKLGHNDPVHKFVCAIMPFLDTKGIGQVVQLVLDRGVPLSTQKPDIPNPFGLLPDHPLTSYKCLHKRWLELAPDKAYEVWCEITHVLSKHPRHEFLDHMCWFVKIIPKLSDEQDVITIGSVISDIGRWHWIEA